MTTALNYAPERIWKARQAYFDGGRLPPDHPLDAALLRSWQRCDGRGRSATESVVFDPVERGALLHLLDEQRELLEAAQPVLEDLSAAVALAGYAVLLTDAQGRALTVAGGVERGSAALRQAFRPGVDVSEAAIGTSAMSLALAEARAVRVLGPEHYFADNQIFHCCAAPVFNARGRLLGCVDATRDMPGLAAGAMALTQRSAERIGHSLFQRRPAFVRIDLGLPGDAQQACLAFDADGEWVAATPAACRLVDVPFVPDGMGFDDLFEERFEVFVTALRRGGAVSVRLKDGVQLRAAECPARPGPASGRAVPRRLDVGAAAPQPRPSAAQGAPGGAFEQALRAFDAGVPVLVTGETGAGKEVAARALHDASARRAAPFVAVNCGAIAPELVAAELFGHVEGAYTGARRGGSAGRIAAADGGTVLLDEIGEMPLDLQVALLRVLDDGEVTPVGAVRPRAVDVRFVCATHRDLAALVAAGRFREDLYYRLSGYMLTVPPLRQRADFDAVVDAVCARLGCDPQRLGPGLRAQLKAMPWPGNVRQLRHALALAVALAAPDEEALGLQHFPAPPPSRLVPVETPVVDWKSTQQRAIDGALLRTQGNVAAAAELLGIGRATLYRKLAANRG